MQLPQLVQSHPDERIKVCTEFPKTPFAQRYCSSKEICDPVISNNNSRQEMYRVILVIVLVSLVAFCTAQVNFSPNWGKRGFNPGNDDNGNNCRESMDNIVLIYKLIQVNINNNKFIYFDVLSK